MIKKGKGPTKPEPKVSPQEKKKPYAPEDIVNEIRSIVNAHMRLAFKQYKELKNTFGTPNKATANFMKSVAPKSFHGIIDDVDKWIESQVETVEKEVESRIYEEKGRLEKKETAYPTFEDLQKIVNEQLKLGFTQYKTLREKYGIPNKALVDYTKSILPKNTHTLIDDVTKWVSDQVDKWEESYEKLLEQTAPKSK
jgi:hypothetical protein